MKVGYVIFPDKDKRKQVGGPGEAVAEGSGNGDLLL